MPAVIISVLSFVLWLALMVLIARFVFDLIFAFAPNWNPGSFLATLANIVFTLTDPPLRQIRRVLPPVRFGGIALDFGLVVLFLIISVLQRLLYLF